MTREEAIETVRRCCPRISDSKCDFESAMRVLFPELRESEDEKIRNCLCCLTSLDQAQDVIADMGFTRQDLLAYLEKQKDLDKMIVVSPEVWDTAISDAFENGKKEGEKQKEQKPVARENDFVSKDEPVEWSEEDEHRRTDAIYFLESAKRHYADTSEIEAAICWIAELRPSWKPSEWQQEVDLEEEINRFLASEESTTYENAGSYKVAVKDPKKIARHFAEWQKQQMLKEAAEGEVVKDINNKLAVTAKINLDGFKFGDKVRIIIVKED